jgi:adenosylcobinamide-phosphate synthase
LITGQLDRLPTLLKWLAGGLLLKQTFSLRGLSRAAGDIHRPLAEGDLPEARGQVSWHLVSRDTSELTESQIVAATVESLAENASDSVVAPLFYYLVLGLPGALAYRFANTADAMLGYRDEAREWLGKIPAHLDDVTNLLPSRLTALLFIAAAFLAGENGREAFSIWRRDGDQGQSPNAGQPMSAVAGALDLELEKVGRYKFGEGNREPAVADIGRAVRLLYVAVLLGIGLATAVLGFRKKGAPA